MNILEYPLYTVAGANDTYWVGTPATLCTGFVANSEFQLLCWRNKPLSAYVGSGKLPLILFVLAFTEVECRPLMTTEPRSHEGATLV